MTVFGASLLTLIIITIIILALRTSERIREPRRYTGENQAHEMDDGELLDLIQPRVDHNVSRDIRQQARRLSQQPRIVRMARPK
jgi:hypothetical protein